MKKLGFAICGIAIVLIVLGLVLLFLPADSDTKSSKSSKKLKNDSEELEKLHCLDKLCIEKMDVVYDKEKKLGIISFYLQNTGDVDIPTGFMKVVFDNSNKKEFILRYGDFLPGDTQSVEIEFTEEDITQTTDYEMQWLTEEEIQSIYS